jgi:hypothetical protein
MPVHQPLEKIFNEYIVAAGLRSGQPLFRRVNLLETAITDVLSTGTTPGVRFVGVPMPGGPLMPVEYHTWRERSHVSDY